MPALPVRLALVLLCAVALTLTACDSRSSSSSSASSGKDLRQRLAKGQRSAMDEIAKMGADAVPLVISCLESDDHNEVAFAAMATKKMGEYGNQTVEAMVAALGRFPNDDYLKQAIKLKARRDAALPAVIKALKSGDRVLQEQAAKLMSGSLAEIGEPAVDPLIALLETDIPDRMKMEVMGALASIGIPADERARPVLIKIQAQGGKVGKHAGTCIKRLDSAHAWKAAREAMEAEKAGAKDDK